MAAVKGLSLTSGSLTGLLTMHRYRILTIQQFARIVDVRYDHAAEVLRLMEARGIVGYFGFTSIPGHGRTPKVYYLKRRGFEYLVNESDQTIEEIGGFHDVHKEFSWMPQMYHRLRLLDCFIALEVAIRKRDHLTLVQTFLEYRRLKGTHTRETTDFVTDIPAPENRIVPDGAFVIANKETDKRGLFFVEMDMGTERIAAPASRDQRATILLKFQQYDRYLTSGRFARMYEPFGDFNFFTLLLVTLGPERLENIRKASAHLPANLHAYYRLALFDAAVGDFVGPVWKSRDRADTLSYALVRQP